MKILNKFSYFINLLIYIIIMAIVLTIINLFLNINQIINKIIILVSLNIYILIQNIKLGKRITNKAYIKGLKQGTLTVIFLYILSLITFTFKLTMNRIIYYIITIVICILGHIIGINKKDLNN